MNSLSNWIRFRDPPPNLEAYVSLISQVFPGQVFQNEDDLFHWVTHCLPLAGWNPVQSHWVSIHLICFASHEFNQQDFFLEMIKLHFKESAALASFHNIPFYLKNFESKPLLLLSALFAVTGRKLTKQFQQNLDSLVQILKQGCRSPRMAKFTIANSILAATQFTEMTEAEKIFLLHKCYEKLLRRFTNQIDADLFSELGSFISFCSPSFFELRSYRFLGRIILSQYMMRKNVKRNLLQHPEKRPLYFRLFHTQHFSFFGKKSAVGIMVVLSLDKYESFDEEHIFLIIQRWIPEARLVQGSCYRYQKPQDEKICTLYLEINKEEGSFSLKELRLLKSILSVELKECIQKLMPVLFAVRNEEQS